MSHKSGIYFSCCLLLVPVVTSFWARADRERSTVWNKFQVAFVPLFFLSFPLTNLTTFSVHYFYSIFMFSELVREGTPQSTPIYFVYTFIIIIWHPSPHLKLSLSLSQPQIETLHFWILYTFHINPPTTQICINTKFSFSHLFSFGIFLKTSIISNLLSLDCENPLRFNKTLVN